MTGVDFWKDHLEILYFILTQEIYLDKDTSQTKSRIKNAELELYLIEGDLT